MQNRFQAYNGSRWSWFDEKLRKRKISWHSPYKIRQSMDLQCGVPVSPTIKSLCWQIMLQRLLFFFLSRKQQFSCNQVPVLRQVVFYFIRCYSYTIGLIILVNLSYSFLLKIIFSPPLDHAKEYLLPKYLSLPEFSHTKKFRPFSLLFRISLFLLAFVFPSKQHQLILAAGVDSCLLQ